MAVAKLLYFWWWSAPFPDERFEIVLASSCLPGAADISLPVRCPAAGLLGVQGLHPVICREHFHCHTTTAAGSEKFLWRDIDKRRKGQGMRRCGEVAPQQWHQLLLIFPQQIYAPYLPAIYLSLAPVLPFVRLWGVEIDRDRWVARKIEYLIGMAK